MTVNQAQLDTLSVAAIRTLAIDAIEKAKSGHPGMPMGLHRWVISCSRKR